MFLQKVISALGGIKYAVVGGYAVSLHGAVRGTVDVDLVVSLEERSLVKVEEALQSLGLASRLPVGAAEVFKFREEYIQSRNLKAWTFVNPSVPTEVVDILITHDVRRLKTVSVKTAFGKIKVVSVKDLIQMKRESGREQDLADIAALEKL